MHKHLLGLLVGATLGVAPALSHAWNDCNLGEVTLFAGSYAPSGWMLAQGQLLSIGDNMALYSLLGNTYGGDGRSNFALPDLRGRAPIGAGQSTTLGNVPLGQQGMPTKGGDQASLPSYLALNFVICVSGNYPVRP